MAEEKRRPSGGSTCSLKHIYGGLFRRTPGHSRRSVSSSSASADISIDNTTRPISKRRSYSDVSSLNAVAKNNLDQRPLPVIPVVAKQIVSSKPRLNLNNHHPNGTNKNNVDRQQQQPRKAAAAQHGIGISGDLDAFVSDPQRNSGVDKFVRASSSNVMLFGELGNLGGGHRGGSGWNNLITTPTPIPIPIPIPTPTPSPSPSPLPSRRESSHPKPSILCRALSKRFSPEELKEKGNEEHRNGRHAEALMFYDQAIKIDSTKASYYSNKAAALTGLGRFLQAVNQCKEAIRIEPSYKKAHCRLGTLYLRLGDGDKALQQYKLAGDECNSKDLKKAQNLKIHMINYDDARRLKDWTTVLKESELAISSGADSAPQVFATKAEALLRLRRHHEAEMAHIDSPTFQTDESTKFFGPSTNSYILTVRSEIYMSIGRFDEAVRTSQMATRIDPGSREATRVARKSRAVALARSRGNELFKASRFAEATRTYRDGLDCDSNNSVLLFNRSACQMKVFEWEKAIEDCTKALNLRPYYSKARARRANCYTKVENWEAAIEDYRVLMEECPSEEFERAIADSRNRLKKLRGDSVSINDNDGGIVSIWSEDQFTSLVKSTGTLVVLFYDDNSSEANEMTPFMEKLNTRYPSVTFAKVDIEEFPDIVKPEEVCSIPTMKIYKDGSWLEDMDGSDWGELERRIKSHSS